ncbi:MAG: type I DNA topoisomerase [Anaerolineae bacterium]
MPTEPITAYCVKCKEKRPMNNPEAVYTQNGTPGTRGQCPVCGTNMFKMGRTPAHEDLPKPEVKAGQRARKKGKRAKRSGKLVIVESPAKARTVGKFLGKGYKVKASVGHVRDLLRSQLSVDVENDFAPKYRVPNEKRDVVKELKAAVDAAQEVYLATDPDREGEAIAWHLIEATGIEPEQARRVVFHEITKDAVAKAFAQPRDIDMKRVDAQQARRILDRLVGYMISPLLWNRVRGRTSAGRVQSVALRLIVEREREIEDFVPEEYWSIKADLTKQDRSLPPKEREFEAELRRIAGKKIDLKTEADTHQIVADLEKSSYQVSEVKRGERRRNPAAPFITSTLQQEASRRLGFGARKTMRIAQQLYEGVELGKEGTVGLITYMRTDSTNVAQQAQAEARAFIAERYGKELLPDKPPRYKTRAKAAQEAHEAIRPTGVRREPKRIKTHLSRDQYRLYTLIWQRFVASQMAPAIYDTMTVIVDAGPNPPQRPYRFRASGSQVKFRGFLTVYEESLDEDAKPEVGLGVILPDLDKGEIVDLLRLLPEQHFTQPPPRYTEATLVRTLEKHGIGRPSTYAPIITTIQQRGYAERQDKRLVPTELGRVVNDLLVEHFPDVVDIDFTAKMEEDLDHIARGERAWVPVVSDFYGPFSQAVKKAEASMPKVEIADKPIGEKCEKCGHDLVLKHGRFGKFIACSNFPECRNTRPWLEPIGVKCPNDGGELVERRTRRGRIFYGCANYPNCDWSSWKKPLPNPCPVCGGILVVQNRKWAKCLNCEEQVALDNLPPLPVERETPAKPEERTLAKEPL